MTEDQHRRPRAKLPTLIVIGVVVVLVLYGIFATNIFFGG